MISIQGLKKELKKFITDIVGQKDEPENKKDQQIKEKQFIIKMIDQGFFQINIEKKVDLIESLIDYYLKAIKDSKEANVTKNNYFAINIEEINSELTKNTTLALENNKKIEKLKAKNDKLSRQIEFCKLHRDKTNNEISDKNQEINEKRKIIRKNMDEHNKVITSALEEEKKFAEQNPKNINGQDLHATFTDDTLKRLKKEDSDLIMKRNDIQYQFINKLEKEIKELKEEIENNNVALKCYKQELIITQKELVEIEKLQDEIKKNIGATNKIKEQKEQAYRKEQAEIKKEILTEISNYNLKLRKHTFFIHKFMEKLQSLKQKNEFLIQKFKKIIETLNTLLEQYLTDDNFENDLLSLPNDINDIINHENFKDINKDNEIIDLSILHSVLQNELSINSDYINSKLITNYFSKIIENQASYLIKIKENENEFFFVKMNAFEKLEEYEQIFMNNFYSKNKKKITKWKENKKSKILKIFYDIKEQENHYCLIFFKKPKNRIEGCLINLSNPTILKVPKIFFSKTKQYEKSGICLRESKKFLKLQNKILNNKNFDNLDNNDIQSKLKSNFAWKLNYYYDIVIKELAKLEKIQTTLEEKESFVEGKIKNIFADVKNKFKANLTLQINMNNIDEDIQTNKDYEYYILNITNLIMQIMEILMNKKWISSDESQSIINTNETNINVNKKIAIVIPSSSISTEPIDYAQEALFLDDTNTNDDQNKLEHESTLSQKHSSVLSYDINHSTEQECLNLNIPQPSTNKSSISYS